MINNLSKYLFWDTDIKTIDVQKNAPYIIHKVVCFGKLEDWKKLIAFYGNEKIKQVVINDRALDPKTLSYLSFYFNIPKENFVCYTTRQLQNPHWNY